MLAVADIDRADENVICGSRRLEGKWRALSVTPQHSSALEDEVSLPLALRSQHECDGHIIAFHFSNRFLSEEEALAIDRQCPREAQIFRSEKEGSEVSTELQMRNIL